jgi:hypothetical protein
MRRGRRARASRDQAAPLQMLHLGGWRAGIELELADCCGSGAQSGQESALRHFQACTEAKR